MKPHLAVVLFLVASCTQAQTPPRPTLGLELTDVDDDVADSLDLDDGAAVASVVPNGPAQQAGIIKGDILLSIDGVRLVAFPVLMQTLSMHQPGQVVKVEILHPTKGKYEKKTVSVRLGGAPAQSTAPSPAQPASGSGHGFHAIENAPRAEPKSSGLCHAMAPAEWGLTAGADGQTAELHGPNGAYAAWGVRSVDRGMQPYYGDLYGDPDTSNRALLAMVLHDPGVRYTSNARQVGYFAERRFQSGAAVGLVLYHVYPGAMGTSPGSYIISTYIAWVPPGGAKALPVAASVMASIRCTSMPHPSGSTGGRGGKGDGEAPKDLDTYNAQLGTQHFHSPTTGETVIVDRNSAWSDTGPDGPGVYRKTPNGVEKLVPGM